MADRDFHSLALEASNSERAALMQNGKAPSFEQLVGWEFAGLNTAPITDLVRIRKFIKGFYEGPPRVLKGPTPFIQGFNIKVEQFGKRDPHIEITDHSEPVRHGFFRVYAVEPKSADNHYPNALLLNYGLGKNGMDPSALLRDYLVQPYPNNPDLLLGLATLKLGPWRVPAGFFVLNRIEQHSFKG